MQTHFFPATACRGWICRNAATSPQRRSGRPRTPLAVPKASKARKHKSRTTSAAQGGSPETTRPGKATPVAGGAATSWCYHVSPPARGPPRLPKNTLRNGGFALQRSGLRTHGPCRSFCPRRGGGPKSKSCSPLLLSLLPRRSYMCSPPRSSLSNISPPLLAAPCHAATAPSTLPPLATSSAPPLSPALSLSPLASHLLL